MAALSFSLDGYRTLLTGLIGRGYQVRRFAEVQPDKPHLVLRHDLDMSIEAAVEIAEIEAELGTTAHHFPLLRTEFYNVFSRAGTAGLRRIAALGHHIGLHFDASLYEDNAEVLDRMAERECRVLEDLIGAPIEVISFHRPSTALMGLDRLIAGRLHTYLPRFFSDIGYCSDSQGSWRFGEPFDNAAVTAGTALQLLTHPLWWTSDAAAGVIDKLEAFLRTRDALLHDEMAANCLPYRAHRAVLADEGRSRL